MRKRGILESSDERILGTGAFVEKMAAEAEGWQSRLLTGVSALKEVREIIETICSKEGVNVSEVKGGRRRQISQVRKRIAAELIERYGIPMVIARETGVTTTAVSKIMAK